MRAIDIKHAEVGTITSRVDGSVRFAVITPELTLEQRSTMLGLHGINVRVMLEPVDVPIEGLDEVATEISSKTPAQRLRAVLFVHYRSIDTTEDFETFYRKTMDKIIEGYKRKNLPEQII